MIIQSKSPAAKDTRIRGKMLVLLLGAMSIVLVSCGRAATENEYVTVATSKSSYASSEQIEFEVTFKKWVSSGNFCSTWFEEKKGQAWQKVGECHPTNLAALPTAYEPGRRERFSMPTVSVSSPYSFYTYSLTPGTYRLATMYSTGTESITAYSPEFKVE